MIIDCIADLHGFYPELEGGDLLIVAGDLTKSDKDEQHLDFIFWLGQIQGLKNKYKKVVYIAGNHDNFFYDKERNGVLKTLKEWNIEYLCDSGTEFQGFKIWGSPWTPWFADVNPHCAAFMLKDSDLFDKWIMIPEDTDILITHGPAYGILDEVPMEDGSHFHVGSQTLFGYLKYVHRPAVHIFGHIHEAYGIKEVLPTYHNKMMKSINCSHVNEFYKPVNKPIRIEL